MRKVSSKQLKKMMKQMGVKEIHALQVTIRCADKEIIVTNPQVVEMNVAGQKVYQISGTIEERTTETEKKQVEIPEADAMLVAQQAGVTLEEAKKALAETEGDLAKAILLLKK